MTEGARKSRARRGSFPRPPEKPHRSVGDRERRKRKSSRRSGNEGPTATVVRASQRDTSPRGRLGAAEPPRRARGRRRRQAARGFRLRSGKRNAAEEERGGCRHPPAGPRDNANGQASCHRPHHGGDPPAIGFCLRRKKKKNQKTKSTPTRRTTRASHGDRGPGGGGEARASHSPPKPPFYILSLALHGHLSLARLLSVSLSLFCFRFSWPATLRQRASRCRSLRPREKKKNGRPGGHPHALPRTSARTEPLTNPARRQPPQPGQARHRGPPGHGGSNRAAG